MLTPPPTGALRLSVIRQCGSKKKILKAQAGRKSRAARLLCGLVITLLFGFLSTFARAQDSIFLTPYTDAAHYAVTPAGDAYTACKLFSELDPTWIQVRSFRADEDFHRTCGRPPGGVYFAQGSYSSARIFDPDFVYMDIHPSKRPLLPNLTVYYSCKPRETAGGSTVTRSDCTPKARVYRQPAINFVTPVTSYVLVPENTVLVGSIGLFALVPNKLLPEVRYELSGNQADFFKIDSGGTLRFKTAPNYERPAGIGQSNDYEVYVSGFQGPARFYRSGTQRISVRVINAPEPPAYTISARGTTPVTRELDGLRLTSTIRIADDVPATVWNNPDAVQVRGIPVPETGAAEQTVLITVTPSAQVLPSNHSFGYLPHQTFVDISITVDGFPLPTQNQILTVCLPVHVGLHEQAAGRPLGFFHHDGTGWQELSAFSLNAAGDQMCGDAISLSPFAIGFEMLPVADRDQIAKHWLARFGRTVATQAVDAIADRMMSGTLTDTRIDTQTDTRTDTPVAGSQLTLAGQRLNLRDLTRTDAAGYRLTSGSDQKMTGEPSATGLLRNHHQPAAGGWMPSQYVPPQRTRSLSLSDVLSDSNFDLRLSNGTNNREGSNRDKPATLWGKMVTSSFDGEPTSTLSLDGKLVISYLGIDFHTDKGLLGVAISRSEGEGDFTFRGDATGSNPVTGLVTGEVDTSLTSIYPYLRWSVSNNLDAWGLLGFGAGDLKLGHTLNVATATSAQDFKTDVEMRMIALGLRGALPSAGAVDLAIKADVFAMRMQSDTARGQFFGENTILLQATDSTAQRLRVILEARRSWALPAASVLTPSLELGARWDEGDADTGMGAEFGGGVTWYHPHLGLELAARGRMLVSHETRNFDERGASMSFRKTVGSDGQGLAFALTPTWGNASSGVNSLWSREPGESGSTGFLSGGSTQRSISTTPDQLAFELSWGLLRPGGLLTPYTQMRMAQGRMSSVREGLRLVLPRGGVSLEVFGEHRLQANQPANHGIGLTGRIEL